MPSDPGHGSVLLERISVYRRYREMVPSRVCGDGWFIRGAVMAHAPQVSTACTPQQHKAVHVVLFDVQHPDVGILFVD